MARFHGMQLWPWLLVLAACTTPQARATAPRTEASASVVSVAGASAIPTAISSPATATAPSAPTPSKTQPCDRPDPDRRASSPDGRVTVFVSVDATRSDETAVGTVAHEDLCVVRQGTPARVLLAGTGPGDLAPDRTLASFGHLVFSPDGTRLFFTTAAWVTSGAAHAVDLDTGKESFLFDGAIVAPITKGPSAGHYLASHYRLDADHPIDSPHYRGRMETWSLVTKDGRTLRRLTDAEAQRLGAPGP